jgi:hypothetical protein
MGEREERIERNEKLFREVNERIETLHHRLGDDESEPQEWLCECADAHCVDRIELTVDEYERTHAAPNRFVVKIDHVVPDVERVLERSDRYAVVEKVATG